MAGLDGFADARRKWNDQSGSMRQRLDSEFMRCRGWVVRCVGELRGARWVSLISAECFGGRGLWLQFLAAMTIEATAETPHKAGDVPLNGI